MAARIPLIVLGGFLGAGKTTLLNHLLSQADRRVAVMVNDFGPIDVDASLVASHDGETLSLTNGCICCSIGSGLDAALIRVLERKPAPELIVIEASGVSDPGRIAQVGLSDPMLQLEAVVVMADAGRIVAQLDDPLMGDTVARQIRAASLVVMNKADLLGPGEAESVEAELRARYGALPFLRSSFGRVPLERILAHGPGGHAPDGDAHHHEDPDHPFEGGVWSAPGMLNADRLIAALKGLPADVIRVKGRVVTDRHGSAVVQLAGGRVRIEKAPAAAEAPRNELVYIGLRGRGIGAAVSAALDALAAESRAG
ncbi:G3E family GTPase [Parapusillimonas granuli]|nr:G3E family GTPase [Parapusillimonas granuli]